MPFEGDKASSDLAFGEEVFLGIQCFLHVNEFHFLICRFVAGVLLFGHVSCTTIEVRKDEPVSSWVARDSMKRKSEASAGASQSRIAGRPVDQFFQRHSAIISDGGMPTVFQPSRVGGSVGFSIPASEGYGSAVSLGDGYFLTAAHVPLKGHGGIFCIDEDGIPVARPYRVVWKEEDADIALLHAAVDVPGVRWASGGEIGNGAGVFTFGYGGGEWKPSQGQILGHSPTGEGNRHADLKLTAPVVAGDSGGPVVTPDGKLVGIVTRADYRWIRAFGRAWMRSGSHTTRPDIGYLQSIIARDRTAHQR